MQKIKRIGKSLVPPILQASINKLYKKLNVENSIYDGFYSELIKVPEMKSNPFEHPNWISYASARAESRKNGVHNQDMHEMSLSLLASIQPPVSETDCTNVVDFGGGVGMYWPAVKAQNMAGKKIKAAEYIVIDSPKNCVAGKKIFTETNIDFQSDLELTINTHLSSKKKINVLNVASTLQYCLDYVGILKILSRSKAKFIVISRHPAPDNGLPIAYTMQNVVSPDGYCGQHPVVLINVQILANTMKELGYSLITDYFSDVDPEKYFRFSRSSMPEKYKRIKDHSLVFQCDDTYK